jgi:uncharacterized protein YecT (DUF1311 family)
MTDRADFDHWSARCGAIVAALCLMLSISSASFAQNRQPVPEPETEYDRCISTGEAAQGVMPAIYDCQRAELDREDAELNRVYRLLRQRLPPAASRKLQIEQRAWLKRRDPKCLKESNLEDGTQDSQMDWLNCLIMETGGRATELGARLKTLR